MATPPYTYDERAMMSFDEFDDRFTVLANNDTGDGESVLFETFGEDLEHIEREIAQGREAHVWTVVENDTGSLVVVPGYSRINRIGHLLTEKPALDEHAHLEIEYEDGHLDSSPSYGMGMS